VAEVHVHVQRLLKAVKMVTMLEEQHSVVCFLWAKGLNTKDIHIKMFPFYGGKFLSCKAFHNWDKQFSQERSKVADDA
jgi:hypothetical protein